MRGLRSTLALLVVLIGLGAYIYFAAPDDNFSSESDREEVFASLEAADIQEVKVKAESGEVTTLRKQNDAWQIVEPISAPAEAAEVTSLTSALDDVEIVRVIDENPADPEQYGLASPRLQIDFKAAEGKPCQTSRASSTARPSASSAPAASMRSSGTSSSK